MIRPPRTPPASPPPPAMHHPRVKPHARDLPLRVGTRGSPLALLQTRLFLHLLTTFCPVLRGLDVFEEHAIRTTGDAVQDRRARRYRRQGAVRQGDPRGAGRRPHRLRGAQPEGPGDRAAARHRAGLHAAARGRARRADPRAPLRPPDPSDPFACLPDGAVVGTASVRRQAQLLHARPDLRDRHRSAAMCRRGSARWRPATAPPRCWRWPACAGWGCEDRASVVLDPDAMVPAAGQGIIGITVRADDDRAARTAGGDRGPRGEGGVHRRARHAGGTGRLLPHPDRRPCPAAAERRRCT